MAVIDTIARTAHVFAGGLLAGSVVFFTWSVLRGVTSGSLGTVAVGSLADHLTTISRLCAVLLVLSGGYMATMAPFGADPAYDGLLGVMILLWLVVTALVEVGASKLDDGATFADVRSYYVLAAVAGIVLLIDAGLVAGY